MSFWVFLTEAILISLSGVLAPGPITAVSISKGSDRPWAGALVAIGHGVVEFPLMVAVFFGVGSLFDSHYLRAVIGIAGGLFMFWMGLGLLRNLKEPSVQSGMDDQSPVFSGVLFSIGNPYFLAWWGTVGATLILRSMVFGVMGFVVFAISHWLCDLGWNTFLSTISFQGRQFIGQKFQQAVFLISGVMMLLAGGRLVLDAILVLT